MGFFRNFRGSFVVIATTIFLLLRCSQASACMGCFSKMFYSSPTKMYFGGNTFYGGNNMYSGSRNTMQNMTYTPYQSAQNNTTGKTTNTTTNNATSNNGTANNAITNNGTQGSKAATTGAAAESNAPTEITQKSALEKAAGEATKASEVKAAVGVSSLAEGLVDLKNNSKKASVLIEHAMLTLEQAAELKDKSLKIQAKADALEKGSKAGPGIDSQPLAQLRANPSLLKSREAEEIFENLEKNYGVEREAFVAQTLKIKDGIREEVPEILGKSLDVKIFSEAVDAAEVLTPREKVELLQTTKIPNMNQLAYLPGNSTGSSSSSPGPNNDELRKKIILGLENDSDEPANSGDRSDSSEKLTADSLPAGDSALWSKDEKSLEFGASSAFGPREGGQTLDGPENPYVNRILASANKLAPKILGVEESSFRSSAPPVEPIGIKDLKPLSSQTFFSSTNRVADESNIFEVVTLQYKKREHYFRKRTN